MTSRERTAARAADALTRAAAAASAAAAEGIRRATDPAGQDALFVKPPPAPEIRAPRAAPESRRAPEITPEQAERAAAPLIRAALKLAPPEARAPEAGAAKTE